MSTPDLTMMQATSTRSISRTKKSVEARSTVADCIGKIEKNMSVFAVTRDQFSMIDCIQHGLNEMGPSKLSIWTWCIADYEIETFEWLLQAGTITEALLVIDRTGEQQMSKHKDSNVKNLAQRGLMRRWVEKFGPQSIKICFNHAKIATLDNGVHKLLIRGSMNLNLNPRFEQLDVSEGDGPFDLVHKIENDLPVLPAKYTNQDAADATGAMRLFSADQLKPFLGGGLKIWAK